METKTAHMTKQSRLRERANMTMRLRTLTSPKDRMTNTTMKKTGTPNPMTISWTTMSSQKNKLWKTSRFAHEVDALADEPRTYLTTISICYPPWTMKIPSQ